MRAIVLARKDTKEVDQIVSLLTETSGFLSLTVKGVKKITSKNSPHLEPATLVEIEPAEGKSVSYIAKAQTLELFSGIRGNGDSSFMALAALALVTRATRGFHADRRIFSLLLTFLLFLEEHGTCPLLFESFALKLLSLLGMEPSLDTCHVTGSTEVGGFDIVGGGVISPLVVEEKRRNHEAVYSLTGEGRDILKKLLHDSWGDVATCASTLEMKKNIQLLVRDFVEHHTEFPFVRYEIA